MLCALLHRTFVSRCKTGVTTGQTCTRPCAFVQPSAAQTLPQVTGRPIDQTLCMCLAPPGHAQLHRGSDLPVCSPNSAPCAIRPCQTLGVSTYQAACVTPTPQHGPRSTQARTSNASQIMSNECPSSVQCWDGNRAPAAAPCRCSSPSWSTRS